MTEKTERAELCEPKNMPTSALIALIVCATIVAPGLICAGAAVLMLDRSDKIIKGLLRNLREINITVKKNV